MFLICHNSNKYAALIFIYMEIVLVKICNSHLIFIESKNNSIGEEFYLRNSHTDINKFFLG